MRPRKIFEFRKVRCVSWARCRGHQPGFADRRGTCFDRLRGVPEVAVVREPRNFSETRIGHCRSVDVTTQPHQAASMENNG
jgi:hypothetical protein